jgi:hypothetical protein
MVVKYGGGGGFTAPSYNQAVSSGNLAQVGPSPASIWTTRKIGDLIANVTVEEIHSDELIITEHPVEQGSEISDHAYKRPAEVMIRCGWSDDDPESQGDFQYVQTVYYKLLDLQSRFQLIDILTGKRVYHNMLLRQLTVTTDVKSQTALMLTAVCRQVIFATTTTVSISNDPTVQTQPQNTQAAVQNGTKALGDAPYFHHTGVQE